MAPALGSPRGRCCCSRSRSRSCCSSPARSRRAAISSRSFPFVALFAAGIAVAEIWNTAAARGATGVCRRLRHGRARKPARRRLHPRDRHADAGSRLHPGAHPGGRDDPDPALLGAAEPSRADVLREACQPVRAGRCRLDEVRAPNRAVTLSIAGLPADLPGPRQLDADKLYLPDEQLSGWGPGAATRGVPRPETVQYAVQQR